MKKMKINPLSSLLGLALTLSGTSAVLAQSGKSSCMKTIGTPSAVALGIGHARRMHGQSLVSRGR
jgi:hypothetical protein